MGEVNAWAVMQHSTEYALGIVTEGEFLSLARKVWEDVPDGSLGVTMVRRSHAILRWASELDLPDAERTDFWRDLDRALREQEPELIARFEAEIAEAPHPAPTSVETMLVTFRGIDFRLILRAFREQRRASCGVEVLRDGRWEELAGLNVRENEMKFHRGIECLHSYAYEHGTVTD